MRMTIALLVSMLGASFGPALTAQETGLAGHWAGAIVLTAAEQEVDIEVDFSRAGDQVQGQLWFPITADGAHALDNLVIQGSHVSFSVKDKDGVVSAFDGALSPDGASLRGTMKESGRLMAFNLHRAKAAAPAREFPVYKLVGDGVQLKAAFNGDAGKTRLLLLLHLGSFTSRMTLRLVERYVLDQIGDPNLRVYAVWMVPDRPEAAGVLQQEAALAPDPRITRFWTSDPSLANLFEPMLAPYKPVSDPCLLFGPDRSWTATAPAPDRIRARSGAKRPLNPAQKLNGVELASDVQLFLAAKNGR